MNEFASSSRCRECGAELPVNAPHGLCPRCLLLGVAAQTEPGEGTGGSKPAPPSIERLAGAFPQLEIIELIGQGGMGCVFKARQSQLDRVVALKILPESLAADTKFAERFAREARALASLSHPNIVTVHDFGRAGDFYYLLMEHVDGVNLRQALRAGRFTPEQALAIVPPLCDALQFAHDRGIVHREVDVRLDEVVLRALEREPARRYQQVSELKTAVETVVASPPRDISERQETSDSDAVPPRIASVEGTKRALKGPAIGMLVAATITPLLPAVLLRTGVLSPGQWMVWPFLFVLLLAGLTILGAVRMWSLKSRRQAMAGVIAGFALGFFNPACLPFCIWGLVVLSRDDVRVAFRDESKRGLPLTRSSPIGLAKLAGLVVGLSALASVPVFVALLPDEYSSVARVGVKVEPAPDGRLPMAIYDPYLITTEFEKLRSKAVLYPLIEELRLNERWGTRLARREPLSIPDAYEMLRNRIDVRQVRNTTLIEIRVRSQDRHEAAELANAIADRYKRVRGEGVVQIVDRAEPAPRASRPSRPLGLFVGAVLALLLGLVASGLTLFLANRKVHVAREKRGGAAMHKPIAVVDEFSEALSVPDPTTAPPELLFDREWALRVIDRAIMAILDEARDPADRREFEILKPWLTGQSSDLIQGDAARQLGLNEGAVRVRIHRLRRRFRDRVKAEIAQTVQDPADVGDELRHLIAVLS